MNTTKQLACAVLERALMDLGNAKYTRRGKLTGEGAQTEYEFIMYDNTMFDFWYHAAEFEPWVVRKATKGY